MAAQHLVFDEDLEALVERQAAINGVSAAEYAREAVLMRLLVDTSRRDDPDRDQALDRILAARDAPSGDAAVAGEAAARVAAAVRDPARLRALKATGLLDAPPDEAFDRLAILAAEALAAPTAAVSLVDRDRQVFKGAAGLDAAAPSERALSHSLCQHAVSRGQALVVEDAREDPDLRTNGAVVDGELVAYLGIPLTGPDGHTLGTLCVWDTEPRQWTRGHVQTLEDLARLVTQRIVSGR